MEASLPVIDFAPFLSAEASAEEKKNVARALDKACREIGFFYLKGHGIPTALLASMLEKAREFFETASTEERQRIALKTIKEGGDNARGWLQIGGPGKAAHEAVDMYRPVDTGTPPFTTGMGQNQWPSTPSDFQAVAESYIEQLEELGTQVIKAIALGLEVDEDIFLRRIDKAFWNLRILGYEGRKSKKSNISSESGIGKHTDFGILTFLLADSTPKSLQVLNKDGEWIWADPIEGCYVCNIGDMLAQWTRGAYKSTVHRVCHSSESLRISIPFFFDPNWDAVISPVLPAGDGKVCVDEGIRYKDKFVRSLDYPLWRDPLAEPVLSS